MGQEEKDLGSYESAGRTESPTDLVMSKAKELGRPIRILLVEDSPSDALLTREALKRADIDHTLDHVEDGVQAMQFLHREEPYAAAIRPDIILLDLNMPRKTGHEVLEEIAADSSLRRLPVMVWTTSAEAPDIDAAYDRSANCYVTKPVGLDHYIEVMRSLGRFALSWVSLPSQD